MLSSVLLPAPEGPMMVMNSPESIRRFTLRNSQRGPAAVLTIFSTPRNSIIAVASM